MTLRPMTRAELVEQIAYEYVAFERETAQRAAADPEFYAGTKLMPLEHEFAFSVGRRYCESGRYRPRRDYRYLDWSRIAREARKVLPRMRRLEDEFGAPS